MITVYTRPGCSTCHATKVWLDRNGIEFAERDVSVDRAAESFLIEQGYTQLPVVVAGNERWSGFQIDKLASLKIHHGGSNSGVIEP